jgi:hypothetical protein
MRHLVCSLLLTLNLLSADEGDPICSLVDYTKSPIPRIAGSVNVITGDWIDHIHNGPIKVESSGIWPAILACFSIFSSGARNLVESIPGPPIFGKPDPTKCNNGDKS